MAKLLVTLRLTGQVSNGVARDLLAQLQACTDAFELEGVEVKQSVDFRGDPEPMEVVGVASGAVLLPGTVIVNSNEGPEAVIPLPDDFKVGHVEPPKKSKFKGAR